MVVILVVLLPAARPSQREKDKKKKIIIKKGIYIQTKEARRYLTRKDMDMGHPWVQSIRACTVACFACDDSKSNITSIRDSSLGLAGTTLGCERQITTAGSWPGWLASHRIIPTYMATLK